MPTYRVPVERTEWSSVEFIVDAPDPAGAIVEAEAEAGNYEFGRGNAEYEVGEPQELSEVYLSYHGGECPYCGQNIPVDVVEGQKCDNCGHVFFLQGPADDNKALVISRTIDLIDGLKAQHDPNNINLIIELESCLTRHGICPKCGGAFGVHNGDGSCVQD